MTAFLFKDEDDAFPEVQAIEVGPVKVDTGSDWLDFGFVVALLVILAAIHIVVKKILSR